MKLIVCEDNEVTIKLISKERSVALRHIGRTHRVDLDWFFDVMPDQKYPCAMSTL